MSIYCKQVVLGRGEAGYLDTQRATCVLGVVASDHPRPPESRLSPDGSAVHEAAVTTNIDDRP
jgi:hypothetical protein